MKTDLSFLPGKKQRELAAIVGIIRQASNSVQMIILFGSHARGNFKDPWDVDVTAKSGHVSDYDILVITGKRWVARKLSIWREAKDKCNDLGFYPHVQILVHYIKEVNKRLSQGHFFFSDIKKEGILLYDSGQFELAEAGYLTNEEKIEIAKEHLENFFEFAKEFYVVFEDCFKRGKHSMSAFLLHQAAEHSFKAAGLVLTNYIPQEHLLKELSNYVGLYDLQFFDIFPMQTKEDKELFKLLEYAYIGARYDKDYKITAEQLNKLSPCVKKLIDLTDKVCTEKIKSFEDG